MAKTKWKTIRRIISFNCKRKIKPIISKVVPFNEAGVREAHILSEGQHVRGKIVVKVE